MIRLTIGRASSYTSILHAQALRILRRIYREGFRYQKVGVMFLELVPEYNRQLSFMDSTFGVVSKVAETEICLE